MFAALQRDLPGRFVAIHDGELVGAYSTHHQAEGALGGRSGVVRWVPLIRCLSLSSQLARRPAKTAATPMREPARAPAASANPRAAPRSATTRPRANRPIGTSRASVSSTCVVPLRDEPATLPAIRELNSLTMVRSRRSPLQPSLLARGPLRPLGAKWCPQSLFPRAAGYAGDRLTDVKLHLFAAQQLIFLRSAS
jgi:hypothetical protein